MLISRYLGHSNNTQKSVDILYRVRARSVDTTEAIRAKAYAP